MKVKSYDEDVTCIFKNVFFLSVYSIKGYKCHQQRKAFFCNVSPDQKRLNSHQKETRIAIRIYSRIRIRIQMFSPKLKIRKP